jgi:hypothetical protein
MTDTPHSQLPPADSKGQRHLWIVAIIGLAFCLIALVCSWMMPRDNQLDHLKRQVREEISVGSTREQVEEWARRKDVKCHYCAWPVQDFPPPPQQMLPEVGGVDRADLASFVEIIVPCGTYKVNGSLADNHLWVFLPLDEKGRVKGHHFLTLAELAEDEARRAQARQGRGDSIGSVRL